MRVQKSLQQLFQERPKRSTCKAIVAALVMIAIGSGFTGSLPAIITTGSAAGLGLFGYQMTNMKRPKKFQDNWYTPLSWAVRAGKLIEAEELDQQDYVGKKTALHWAVDEKNFAIAQQLLSKDASPNIQDCHGMTPLHRAARNGDVRMIQLLLQHGASQDLRDEMKKTPYELALFYHSQRDYRLVAQWFRV